MLNCKSLIEGLTPDHPICQSFEWLTKGKDAEARAVWKDIMTKSSIGTSNWYGDINDVWEAFSDVLGCKVTRNRTCKCGKTVESSRKQTYFPMYLYCGANKKIFGQLDDYITDYENQSPGQKCLVNNEACRGPVVVRKKILSDWKKLFVISFEPTDLKLVDVPATYLFDGKKLILQATINKSSCHFTAWIKKTSSWLFYDGMKKQRFEEVEENNYKKIEKMQLGYQLCCLIFEIV